MRQIFPAAAGGLQIELAEPGHASPATLEVLAELYAYPEPSAVTARPWVRANMVTSADGAAWLNGRAGGLSGLADRMVFSVLRSLADVILVGAGTARAERYSPVRGTEALPRLREGRSATPPIAVVSRALDLNLDGPLLAGAAAGRARTIVLTTEAAPPDRRAAAARHADVVVAGEDLVTASAAVSALASRGFTRILAEGGPTLLGFIAAARLLDELCLTYSPVLVGGDVGRIVLTAAGQGGSAPLAGLSLAHVLEDDGHLLCRYLSEPAG